MNKPICCDKCRKVKREGNFTEIWFECVDVACSCHKVLCTDPHHDSWEEEFDKQFVKVISHGEYMGIEYFRIPLDPEDVKSFIRSLIASQKDQSYEAGFAAGKQSGIAEVYKDDLDSISTYKSELRKKLEGMKLYWKTDKAMFEAFVENDENKDYVDFREGGIASLDAIIKLLDN